MQAVIVQIEGRQAKHGEEAQGPATAEQIARARVEARERFGATMPDGFVDFLARSNGVDHNGAVIYGTSQSKEAPGPGGFWQGIVAANVAWRDGPGRDGYLALGETDMDLLTVDLSGTNPVLRDKVSGDVNERFPGVTEAIEAVLLGRM